MIVDRIAWSDYLQFEDVAPGSVQLIVTSPPYPGQRSCNLSVPQWLDWMGQVGWKMRRELAHTGVLALNVKFKRRNDGRFDTRLFRDLMGLLEDDLKLWPIDVYVWNKKNPVPAGNMDRYPIPQWEPVFLFGKSEDYLFQPVRKPYTKKSLNKLKPGNRPRANSVGHTYNGGHSNAHPLGALQGNVLSLSSSGGPERPRARGGSFPPGLARRFILQHTRAGDLVLDPFCGVGTALKEAQRLGRRWLGTEIDRSEAERAQEWVAGGE